MDEIGPVRNEPNLPIRDVEASAQADIEKARKATVIKDKLYSFFSQAATISHQDRTTLINTARDDRTLSQTKYNSITRR